MSVIVLSAGISSASVASSVRRWSAIDQPTTLRLYESMITARYSQPSHVRT